MQFDLTISGQTQLGQALNAVITAVSNEALRAAADQLRSAVEIQFLTEGSAYADTPWLPRKARRAQLQSWPLLIRSGRLLRSLADERDPEHIEELSDGQLLFGSQVPYAAAHQRGTRHMPARPLLTAKMLAG